MSDWRKEMDDEALRKALPYLMSAPRSNAHHRNPNSTGPWIKWYREPAEAAVTVLRGKAGKTLHTKLEMKIRAHHTFPLRTVPDTRFLPVPLVSRLSWVDLLPRQ